MTACMSTSNPVRKRVWSRKKAEDQSTRHPPSTINFRYGKVDLRDQYNDGHRKPNSSQQFSTPRRPSSPPTRPTGKPFQASFPRTATPKLIPQLLDEILAELLEARAFRFCISELVVSAGYHQTRHPHPKIENILSILTPPISDGSFPCRRSRNCLCMFCTARWKVGLESS